MLMEPGTESVHVAADIARKVTMNVLASLQRDPGAKPEVRGADMAWSTEDRHKRGYDTMHDKICAELIRTVNLCEESTHNGRSTLGTIADNIDNGGNALPTLSAMPLGADMAWSRESRHKRGYGIAHDKIRAELIRTVILCEERSHNGRTTLATIADHIIPLGRGGSGQRSNHRLFCPSCSDAKGLADKGHGPDPKRGVDLGGRPTDPNQPWNR